MEKRIKITDEFWANYMSIVKNNVIPFQWRALNDQGDIQIQKERNEEGLPSDKSNAIENFKVAARQSEGEHYGWWFQDTDVYKWLESVGYSLKHFPDSTLEKLADGVIDLIEEAQEADGYLNTFYQIKAPKLKFRRLLESHELYCAGHLIEAAIAYYEGTSKDKLLQIARKFADCIDRHFGPEDGKIHGADGHQEIELALVKLYQLTKEEKYLKLSEYFLRVRGQEPGFYTRQLEENIELGYSEGPVSKVNLTYMQAHKPPVEQETAEGHAVRLVYMCTGMAELAYQTNQSDMLKACETIWKNIVERRLYVTGGIGSTPHGEAFTFDYDLPNDTMYCETCAAIGLVYFSYSMLKNNPDSQYANIMERALYNNVLSGMSLDGKQYFYANPLESHPEASQRNPGKGHVKSTRPDWFGCACCPPNLARTISSLDRYIYTTKENALYTHLFMNHEADMTLNGQTVKIKQEIDATNAFKVTFTVRGKCTDKLPLYIRVPNWTTGYEAWLNNEKVTSPIIEKGYLKMEGQWEDEVKIEIHFQMPVLELTSHPKVRGNLGKVSIQRGPFIYCLEEVDNGADLHLIHLTSRTKFFPKESNELTGILSLEGEGERLIISKEWENQLYQYQSNRLFEPATLTLIPYYAWANRQVGEMQVWINKK